MIWKSDCCQCIVNFDKTTMKLIQWYQKCKFHESFSGQNLFQEMMNHCLSFQYKPTLISTDGGKTRNLQSKVAEKQRIANMGKPIINEAVKWLKE